MNEALEERHFNTIICESRDMDGNKWVYYKARQNITAKEELGTRYSIDGSYWNASKKYTDELLEKVRKCYERDIPFQSNNTNTKEVTTAFRNLTTEIDECMEKDNSMYQSDESSDEENIPILREKEENIGTPVSLANSEYATQQGSHELTNENEGSDSESTKYSDEGN
jgi:hypothetical protein